MAFRTKLDAWLAGDLCRVIGALAGLTVVQGFAIELDDEAKPVMVPRMIQDQKAILSRTRASRARWSAQT